MALKDEDVVAGSLVTELTVVVVCLFLRVEMYERQPLVFFWAVSGAVSSPLLTPLSHFLLCTSWGGSLARLLGHTDEARALGGVEGPTFGAGMGLTIGLIIK